MADAADAGHQVVFATEEAGTVPAADPAAADGRAVRPARGRSAEPKTYYRELTRAPEFGATVGWAGLELAGFDGLLLPGGHAPGMRQYLGSAVLQR